MNQSIPKWLKELQENSWELEILISGGAIFTLFQVSDIWINWLDNMSVISFLPGRTFFMLSGTLGIEILKLGFILHLLLRAFWLSMVCINYVFPGGVRAEKIAWKKPFVKNVVDNDDLQLPILNVDRLCGLVMYLSIISSFFLAGIILTIFIIFSLPMLLGLEVGTFSELAFVFFLIYLLDQMLGGLFRKIPYLTYITYVPFTIFDHLTLRRVYQKASHLFRSNVSRWKYVVSASVFFIIALTFSYLNTYKIMGWPNVFDSRGYKHQIRREEIYISHKFYKDQLDENTTSRVNIQSKFVKDKHVELFIQYRAYLDELVNALPGSSKDRYLSDIIEVAIDDSIYLSVEWHQTLNKSPIDNGLTAVIPIFHLEEGKHILKIGCSNKIDPSKTELYDELCRSVQIPFWKVDD